MRLREVLEELQRVRQLLAMKSEEAPTPGGVAGFRIEGVNNLFDAVTHLAHIPLSDRARAAIREIEGSPVYAGPHDAAVVDRTTGLAFFNAWNRLNAQLDDLIANLIPLAGGALPEIAIQLPPLETLDDFAGVLEELNRCFNVPLGHVFPGVASVRVVGADRGSIWVELALALSGAGAGAGAVKVLPVVSKFVRDLLAAVSEYREQKARCSKIEEDTRREKLGNDYIEATVKHHTSLLEAHRRRLAEQLAATAPPAERNEATNALIHAIAGSAALFERGMRVVERLPAPVPGPAGPAGGAPQGQAIGDGPPPTPGLPPGAGSGGTPPS